MRKVLFSMLAVFLLGALTISSQQPKPGDNAQARTLEVQIHYTGAGTVDASHQIFGALWSSAGDLSGGAPPFAVEGAASKNAVVAFSNVQMSPVFVSAAFDPTGKWSAQSAPPPGASLGMYSKAPPKPDAVDLAPGKTVRITLSFDDKVKTQ
jgi:hypothetical protein